MTAHYKLLLTVALAGLLQAAGARGAAPLPNYAQDKTLGVGSCASSLCHGAMETWKGSNVLQNEYVTWSRSDKHHLRAYAVLLSERSKEIAKKLNLPRPAHLAAECLDCHAHNPRHFDKGFRISDGVACEACHGGAERWIKSHVEPDATHAKNLANGMYPHRERRRARAALPVLPPRHAPEVRHPQDHGGRAPAHELRARYLHPDRAGAFPRSTKTGRSARAAGMACARGRSGRPSPRSSSWSSCAARAGATGCSPSWCSSTAIRAITRWRTGATRPRARGRAGASCA